jgi:dTDP-glucose 4,6-dehydratase
VSDLVEGIYRLAVSGEQGPINIGNPQELSILEFAELVIKLSGSRSNIVFIPAAADDPHRRKPDISKAQQLLGWNPRVPLEEGLASTIEWFKVHHGGI